MHARVLPWVSAAAVLFFTLFLLTRPAAEQTRAATSERRVPADAFGHDAADDASAAEEPTPAEVVGGSEPPPPEPAPTTPAPVPGPPRSFTLAASGDLLPHQAVQDRAAAYAGGAGWEFGPMFDAVRPTIESADLAICHLETMLSPDNTALASYPMFNVPNQLADAIAGAGYDACSVASNHALDRGKAGMFSTLDHLDRVGVRHAGGARTAEERAAPSLYDTAGVRIGHLSYAYGFNGFSVPADAPWVTNQIDAATILDEASRTRAAGAEFVVVSLHWGLEYQHAPTADQRSLARTLLASPDIDLILGHHAHVVQPIEQIDGEYVVYGMGNFLSNQYERPPTQDGVVVRLRIDEQSDGRFRVTSLAAVPTIVERPAFRIVPTSPQIHADSHQRVLGVLSQLGVQPEPGDVAA